jgi:hypothetical protein
MILAAGLPDLVSAYRATRYHVRLPGGRRCTVRIGQTCPRPLAERLGPDAGFAVISACNPRSQPLDARENRRRSRALVERIAADQARCLPAVGVLGEWREPGMCVFGLPLPRLDALARAFDQNAIVVGKRDTAARLRVYRDDWRALPGLSAAHDLEWA